MSLYHLSVTVLVPVPRTLSSLSTRRLPADVAGARSIHLIIRCSILLGHHLLTKLATHTSTNMSWITNIDGKPDPNFKDDGPKVADPAIPDRMVSTKRANQPFLSCVFHSFTNDYSPLSRLGTKHTATSRQSYTPPGASVKTHD